MRLSKKQSDFIFMIAQMLDNIHTYQVDCRVYIKVTSHIRTSNQQLELYKDKKSRTLNSRHLYGLAMDFAPITENGREVFYDSMILDMMGEFWESIGGVWGGNWKNFVDRPHFEYNEKKRNEYLKQIGG